MTEMLLFKLTIFTSVIIVINCVNLDQQCTRPDGQIGVCIRINRCTEILKSVSENSTTVSSDDSQSISCGKTLNKQNPKICCPRIQQERKLSIKVKTLGNRLRDVKIQEQISRKYLNHKNFNLLHNDKCGTTVTSAVSESSAASELSESSTATHQHDKHSWIVKIVHKDSNIDLNNMDCRGSLINNRYVLTTKTCVTNQSPVVSVVINAENKDCDKLNENHLCSPNNQEIIVEETVIFINNKTRGGNIHDIALIRLAEPIQMESDIQPICLPFARQLQNFNFANLQVSSHDLKLDENININLPVKEIRKCNNILKKLSKTPKLAQPLNNLCTDSETRINNCPNEIGTPLMAIATPKSFPKMLTREKYYQIGLLSDKLTCESTENRSMPKVHVRIAFYLNWILDQIRN